jgi:PAS domain S-box-containing protein
MAANQPNLEGTDHEQRYARLLEAVTDYVFHVRVENGRAVETVHASNCEAVTGYSPREFYANPMLWIAMVPLEDRGIVEQQAACILSGRDAPPIEHRIRRKDGCTRWVLNTLSPQRDSRGQLIAYDGLLRDITDRRRAEEALRQLNETLEQRVAQQMRDIRLLAEAVSNLGEGILITGGDEDWPAPTIVFVNKAMCHISGYAADELVGRTPGILHGEGTETATLHRIRTELSASRSCLVELTNYRKNGTPYDAELFITPLVDAQGRRANFVSIHRDITQRKELQKHVLSILSDEQLRIAQELHDGVGQELTGLSLFAGTLLEIFDGLAQRDADEKAVWMLEETEYRRLRQTASRLSRGLVEANRHVHQLAYGIMPVQVDAEGLRAALHELAAATDMQQNVRCWFECLESVTVANNAVATHLYRIAQEALNNALRHGQADQIRIALSEKDGYLVLDVSDNGIGFDPDDVRRAGPSGMGLRTMNYRASMIGGVVHIARAEHGGTLVRCTVLRGGTRE